MYLHPNKRFLFPEFDELNQRDDRALWIIIGDDFNCHHQVWKCKKKNVNGTKLLRNTNTRGYIIRDPPTATRVPSANQGITLLINFFITRNTLTRLIL